MSTNRSTDKLFVTPAYKEYFDQSVLDLYDMVLENPFDRIRRHLLESLPKYSPMEYRGRMCFKLNDVGEDRMLILRMTDLGTLWTCEVQYEMLSCNAFEAIDIFEKLSK